MLPPPRDPDQPSDPNQQPFHPLDDYCPLPFCIDLNGQKALATYRKHGCIGRTFGPDPALHYFRRLFAPFPSPPLGRSLLPNYYPDDDADGDIIATRHPPGYAVSADSQSLLQSYSTIDHCGLSLRRLDLIPQRLFQGDGRTPLGAPIFFRANDLYGREYGLPLADADVARRVICSTLERYNLATAVGSEDFIRIVIECDAHASFLIRIPIHRSESRELISFKGLAAGIFEAIRVYLLRDAFVYNGGVRWMAMGGRVARVDELLLVGLLHVGWATWQPLLAVVKPCQW